MKKILILSLLLLIGCSKKEEYKSFEAGYEILNDYVNIDEDWAEKFGKYGFFYTDYDDFIIVNEFNEEEFGDNVNGYTYDLAVKIIEDVNFYLPKHWPEGSSHNYDLDSDEFTIYKTDGKYPISKGKIFKSGDRMIYVMLSVKEGDIKELYEKTFK